MIFHATCLGFDVEVGGGCLTVSFESIHPSDDKGCPLARSRPPGTSGGELGDLVFFPHRCKIWFPSSRTSCSSGRRHLGPVLVTCFQPRYKHLRTLVLVISQEFSRPAVSNRKPTEVFPRPPSCDQSKTCGSFSATAQLRAIKSPRKFFCDRAAVSNRKPAEVFLRPPSRAQSKTRGSFSATAQL